MQLDKRDRALKCYSFWLFPLICLAVILGGCGGKEPPLSKEAQILKKNLLGEMNTLTTALVEPVAKQDWEAVPRILQTSYKEMEKGRKVVPLRIVVLDRDGISKEMFPKREGQWNFSHYAPARIVYDQKRKTQAMLYFGNAKIFIFMAPLLQKDQITGAVVMGIKEEELQKWKVPEKEFLSIDFNQ